MYTQRQRVFSALLEADAALEQTAEGGGGGGGGGGRRRARGKGKGGRGGARADAPTAEKENQGQGQAQADGEAAAAGWFHGTRETRLIVERDVARKARALRELDGAGGSTGKPVTKAEALAAALAEKEEEEGYVARLKEARAASAAKAAAAAAAAQGGKQTGRGTKRQPETALMGFVDRAVAGKLGGGGEAEQDPASATVTDAEIEQRMDACTTKLQAAVAAEDYASAAAFEDELLAWRKRKEQGIVDAVMARVTGGGGAAKKAAAAAGGAKATAAAAPLSPQLVRCGWDCGARLPMLQMSEHEDQHCVKREVLCPFGCESDRVTVEALTAHKAACRFRPVRCPLGCGESMAFHAKELHVRQLCPRRKVPCQLGCGKHVEIEARDKHEAGACANRIVACARGCGRSLRAALAPAHEEKCSGSAPLCSISSLKCAVVFGDEAAKEALVLQARLALETGSRVLLSAELRENNRSVDDCKLMLRTLYIELRPFCVDQGFLPEVLLEGGGPRGGGVAMLEVKPSEALMLKLADTA